LASLLLRIAPSRPFLACLQVAAFFVAVHGPAAAESTNECARLKAQVIQLKDASKWVEAMPLAERLVTMTVKMHGETSPETAEAIHFWAWLLQENGDLEKAEQLWLRALAIDERLFGKDTIQTTRRLHLLANFYRDQGDYQRAAPLLKKALTLREKHFGPNDPETAQILLSLARLSLLSGDFAAAEKTYLRCVDIFEQTGADGIERVAGTHASLGWLYLAIGDFDQAQQRAQRALELREKLHGTEHALVAQTFRELGIIHFARGEFEQAQTQYERSLMILEKILGTNHVSVAEVLDGLGATFLAQGSLDKAEQVLRRARTILESNFGPDNSHVASVLGVLSQLEEKRGNYDTAREFGEQAYRLREKTLGPSHYLSISTLRSLACLEVVLGRPERALARADQLQESEDRLLANIFSFTSERQRLAYQHGASLFKHRYDLWASLGAVQPLARTILHTKGLVLDSLIEDRLLAQSSGDEQVQELLTKLARARRSVSQAIPLFGEQTPRSTGLRADELCKNVEILEASLSRRISGLGRPRRALRLKLEEVLAAIPARTALIEFVRYKDLDKNNGKESYGALILSRSDTARWIPLGSADHIEKSVKLYRHSVRNLDASQMLCNALDELYRGLWTPLIPALPAGTERIIISPDGELNFVSFATLLTPERRFVGEEYLFSYVSCARDLIGQTNTSTANTNAQLVVFANPDFGPAVAFKSAQNCMQSREQRSLEFPRLPGAEKEGRLLCDRAHELGFSSASLHVGSAATKGELFRVRSPKALHLATHGFVIPQIEAPLSADKDLLTPAGQNFTFTPNPLLRCGLALAALQRSLETGPESGPTRAEKNDTLLTADEISCLDLRGTELVVLSGCDTGGGEARAGEGVLGLRRGFIQAGAQNLLLTLWSIDDEETVGLIRDFYLEVKNTQSPSSALALVQRNWLQKLRIEKGVAAACRLAGPFILSFQGGPR
jgi:CHAT domain-containing protein